MPAIIVSNIKFEKDRYCIDLSELTNIFPHISLAKALESKVIFLGKGD